MNQHEERFFNSSLKKLMRLHGAASLCDLANVTTRLLKSYRGFGPVFEKKLHNLLRDHGINPPKQGFTYQSDTPHMSNYELKTKLKGLNNVPMCSKRGFTPEDVETQKEYIRSELSRRNLL